MKKRIISFMTLCICLFSCGLTVFADVIDPDVYISVGDQAIPKTVITVIVIAVAAAILFLLFLKKRKK